MKVASAPKFYVYKPIGRRPGYPAFDMPDNVCAS